MSRIVLTAVNKIDTCNYVLKSTKHKNLLDCPIADIEYENKAFTSQHTGRIKGFTKLSHNRGPFCTPCNLQALLIKNPVLYVQFSSSYDTDLGLVTRYQTMCRPEKHLLRLRIAAAAAAVNRKETGTIRM